MLATGAEVAEAFRSTAWHCDFVDIDPFQPLAGRHFLFALAGTPRAKHEQPAV